MLSVGSIKALNSFFPMPFARHARITVTNEGQQSINSLYFNIDWRGQPVAPGTLYFHAQYRQAQPNKGWTSDWKTNGEPSQHQAQPDGADNYVWMDAEGHGQFVGVTMSVLQNQDGWWGEGDDMFFIDGATMPTITGTGSEDYFLGAWDFGGEPFSYDLYGAPVVGEEAAGSRSSVFRFHLDAPIPLPSRSRRPSSMAMPMSAPTISIRSPIGTRLSRMPRSRRCRRWMSGCRCWCRWAGRGISNEIYCSLASLKFQWTCTAVTAACGLPWTTGGFQRQCDWTNSQALPSSTVERGIRYGAIADTSARQNANP